MKRFLDSRIQRTICNKSFLWRFFREEIVSVIDFSDYYFSRLQIARESLLREAISQMVAKDFICPRFVWKPIALASPIRRNDGDVVFVAPKRRFRLCNCGFKTRKEELFHSDPQHILP